MRGNHDTAPSCNLAHGEASSTQDELENRRIIAAHVGPNRANARYGRPAAKRQTFALMNDVNAMPPRRWCERIDGICWLPRMIDKARAYDAGTLGNYFFGQSPVDESLLSAAGFGYADVLDAVRKAPDDAGVLAELERRAPGAGERMRAWSAKPGLVSALTFQLVDADEGYTKGLIPSLVRALPIDAMADVLAKILPNRMQKAKP